MHFISGYLLVLGIYFQNIIISQISIIFYIFLNISSNNPQIGPFYRLFHDIYLNILQNQANISFFLIFREFPFSALSYIIPQFILVLVQISQNIAHQLV